MQRSDIQGLLVHMRTLGPAAVVAATLAAGPAFAQSTTITTEQPSISVEERTKTRIKETDDGVEKTTTTKTQNSDGSVTKSKTTTSSDSGPSTTVVVPR